MWFIWMKWNHFVVRKWLQIHKFSCIQIITQSKLSNWDQTLFAKFSTQHWFYFAWRLRRLPKHFWILCQHNNSFGSSVCHHYCFHASEIRDRHYKPCNCYCAEIIMCMYVNDMSLMSNGLTFKKHVVFAKILMPLSIQWKWLNLHSSELKLWLWHTASTHSKFIMFEICGPLSHQKIFSFMVFEHTKNDKEKHRWWVCVH